MNKWMNRAVGTVGVAGGMLLLGAGVAHADDALTPGAPDDLSSSNLGATLDTPGSQASAGMVPNGPLALQKNDGRLGATVHTPGANGESRDVFVGGRAPDALGAVPGNDVMPSGLRSWGLTQQSLLPGTATERGTAPTAQSAPVVPVMGTLSQLPLSSLPVPGLGTSPLGAVSGTTGNLTGADGATGKLSGAANSVAGRHSATESIGGFPDVAGVPLVGGNLPVLTGQGLPPAPVNPLQGNVKPVNDMTIPLGSAGGESTESTTEATSVPGLQYVPLVGQVLQNNTVSGVPQLSEAYQARHAAATGGRHAAAESGRHAAPEESLPVVGGLPLIGNLLGGGSGLL
jgi:hypothetical protein